MDLIKIANTRKALSKKPNKKDCWLAVKSLIDKTPDDENLHELSALYRYFMPNLPAKPKTAEQWVMKAISKNDIRYYLQNAYVNEGRLVATDGHRLHILNGVNLAEGEFYDTQLLKLDNSDNHYGKYPDINRVIPNISKMSCEGLIELDEIEQRPIAPESGRPYQVSILKVERGSVSNDSKRTVEIGVNTTYLAEAISFMANPTLFADSQNPDNCAVLVKDEGADIEAVLMPIRL